MLHLPTCARRRSVFMPAYAGGACQRKCDGPSASMSRRNVLGCFDRSMSARQPAQSMRTAAMQVPRHKPRSGRSWTTATTTTAPATAHTAQRDSPSPVPLPHPALTPPPTILRPLRARLPIIYHPYSSIAEVNPTLNSPTFMRESQ